MRIEYYCPIWGCTEMPFDDFVSRVNKAGYDGVEISFPTMDAADRDAKTDALEDAGLRFIAQHWETENPEFGGHLDEYRRRLEFLAASEPEFISSQTGRDFFSPEDGLRLFAAADNLAETSGVKVIHETHRSKLTFAAHVTAGFLERIPGMRLTLDVSHWFCVHERYLADQKETLDLAIHRTDHIHARVGHIQGSQVPDFRTPEWKEVLDTHLAVWDRIVDAARADGRERLTVTPEFGPAPYMLTLPGTSEPMADQWRSNLDMMALLKERWGT
jgi:sugar phosphate isomerase/epimerase